MRESEANRVRSRLQGLIQQGNEFVGGSSHDTSLLVSCIDQIPGWVSSARHAIGLVCPLLSEYPTHAGRIAARTSVRSDMTDWHAVVGEMNGLIGRVVDDLDFGLLVGVEDKIAGQTFDDFLDHADAYLKDSRKNEAAVIAGVVFEDTIRRICRHYGIHEAGTKLDSLISNLVAGEQLSSNKAKRARAGAGVRTSATHAQWDEFEIDDVKATIDFTRELIDDHLSG